MGRHSILSPSGSHRWLNCTPSARLELEFENAATDAAREGTAAAAEAAKENKEEASEKEPAPELPVEGDYTLFAVQNEGFVLYWIEL